MAAEGENIQLAVNGTLMRGLELNRSLTGAGGRFLRGARTDANYRIWSIADRHPAMLRASSGGGSVELELWELPAEGFAAVLQREPPGLCVGRVVLEDGAQVLGVLAEPWIVEGQREITKWGGWRRYLASGEGGAAEPDRPPTL